MSMLQQGQCKKCGSVFVLEVKLVKMVLEGGEAELA